MLAGQLLAANCSLGIQDVFEEPSIPLPASVLSSFSSSASSLRETPPPVNPENPRPAIATAQGDRGDVPPTVDTPTSNPETFQATEVSENTIPSATQPTAEQTNSGRTSPATPEALPTSTRSAAVNTGVINSGPRTVTSTSKVPGSNPISTSNAPTLTSSSASIATAGGSHMNMKGESALFSIFGWMVAIFVLWVGFDEGWIPGGGDLSLGFMQNERPISCLPLISRHDQDISAFLFVVLLKGEAH